MNFGRIVRYLRLAHRSQTHPLRVVNVSDATGVVCVSTDAQLLTAASIVRVHLLDHEGIHAMSQTAQTRLNQPYPIAFIVSAAA